MIVRSRSGKSGFRFKLYEGERTYVRYIGPCIFGTRFVLYVESFRQSPDRRRRYRNKWERVCDQGNKKTDVASSITTTLLSFTKALARLKSDLSPTLRLAPSASIGDSSVKLLPRDLSGSSEALGVLTKYDLCREDHRWASSYDENGSRFDRIVPLNNKGCKLPIQIRVNTEDEIRWHLVVSWIFETLNPGGQLWRCRLCNQQIFKLMLEGIWIRPFTRQW